MKSPRSFLTALLLFSAVAGQAQKTSPMTAQNNPLLCDLKTGVCDPGEAPAALNTVPPAAGKGLKMIYFTDPICSSCWGIEPQLRRLKLEYGTAVEVEYRMGGLLPDWSYNSGGISKPSDVAPHWDEASAHYDMPIDGDVWLEDPLSSSYPPSIAFKAAQMQDTKKAVAFLRSMREKLFLQKKNITKWEHLEAAAKEAGLDVAQLKKDYESGAAEALFRKDLELAREWGVRGFPTVFFVDNSGNKELVYGSKPYAFYEMGVLKNNPEAVKKEYSKSWESLFGLYPTLTAREFAELSGTPRAESEALLNALTAKGVLEKVVSRNGALWKRK